MEMQKLKNGLAQKCVLVRFGKRVPNFTVTAQDATAQMLRQYGITDAEIARVSTRKMPKAFLAEARAIAGAFYNHFHLRLTMPWSDSDQAETEGGWRLCTNRNAAIWRVEVQKAETAFWQAVAEDLKPAKYHEYVAEVIASAADLPDFVAEKIVPPSLAEVKKKIAFMWRLDVVPDAKDVRNPGLDDDTAKLVTQHNAEAKARNTLKAHKHSIGNVIEQTTVIIDAMNRYGKKGKSGRAGYFLDSFEENIASFVAALPGLNPTDDPELQKLIEATVEKLSNVDNDTLRADVKARAELKKNATLIRKDAKAQQAGLMSL